MPMKDYPWTFEKKFLAEKLRDFAQRAESEKRAVSDPFKDVMMIKCSFANCRVRWGIDKTIWPAIKDPDERIVFDILKTFLSRHEHSFAELGLREQGNFLQFFVGARYVTICKACRRLCPQPTEKISWEHACNNNAWWIPLDQNRQPTMRWNMAGNIWVLTIPFHNLIWEELYNLNEKRISRDTPNKVWLVHDSLSDTVVQLCLRQNIKVIWHKQHQQRARSANGGSAVVVTKKALAAQDILTLLPPEILKKFYRMAVVEMHPDKGGSTETFQRFQEAWTKFNNA